jgi:hypothetical protein
VSSFAAGRCFRSMPTPATPHPQRYDRFHTCTQAPRSLSLSYPQPSQSAHTLSTGTPSVVSSLCLGPAVEAKSPRGLGSGSLGRDGVIHPSIHPSGRGMGADVLSVAGMILVCVLWKSNHPGGWGLERHFRFLVYARRRWCHSSIHPSIHPGRGCWVQG